MYLATWKEYTTPNFTNSEVLGEIRTQEVVSTENFDSIWRTKLFSIFGYEEGAGLSRTKVFDDIVGDLKIDALYIFDKALLTTHHFVVLKDDSYNTKASAYCGGLILKQTDMKTTMLWCSAHQPTQEQINELEEKGRLILKEHSQR
jgi:hypothetical protein